jgi:fibronectin-binding autotransporter adhesin
MTRVVYFSPRGRWRRSVAVQQIAVFAAIMAASGSDVVLAQTVTWNGGNTTWTQPDSDSWTSATYASGNTAVFAGSGTGTVTIDASGVTPGQVNVTAGSYTFTGGAIGGSGGIDKSGTGALTLLSANTYSGSTTIAAGVLNIRNATALGGTAAGTIVSNSAALQLQGGITVTGESLSIAGGGISNDGALRSVSGTNTWAGSVSATLGGAINRIAVDADRLTISGPISINSSASTTLGLLGNGNGEISGNISGGNTGASTVFRSTVGSGTWTLSGSNSYLGETGISTNALTVAGGFAIPDGSRVAFTSSGSLILQASETVGALQTTDSATTSSVNLNSYTLSLGADNGTNASFRTFLGRILGTGGIVKVGTGVQVLSGSNSYSGSTIVRGGTLALGTNGSFNSSPTITVGDAGSSGAVLDLTAKTGTFAFTSSQTVGGIGRLNIGSGNTVSSAGIWAPGNSIGSNTVTGNLTLTGTSQFELGTPGTSTSLPGTSDFTAVSGTLTLGGNLTLLDNAGANSQGSYGAGTYRLFTFGDVSGSYASITPATLSTRAGVVLGGSGTAAGNGVFANVYNLASATSAQTVNLGNTRVGTALTGSLTLTNSAPANATFTETLSGSFSGVTTHFSATGTAGGIAGQASSAGTLLVGLGTGLSAGAQTGTATLALFSNAVNSSGLAQQAVGSQAVTITGTVWNAAAASIASGTSINFGTVLKGTSLSQALSITNTAPNDGFSEKLDTSFGSVAGGASTNAGSISLLAAGGTSTAMSVGLGSLTAGGKSGTVQVNFTSNGNGTSGLGTLPLAPQTVNLTGTVLDPAVASFLSGTSASTSLVLNFGTVNEGDSVSQGFSLYNLLQTAGYTADLALVSISPSNPTGPFSTNLGTFNTLASGSSNSWQVFLNPAGQGSFSNIWTLQFKSSNGGAVYTSDTPQTLTLTANVIVVPEPGTLALAGVGIAAAAWAARRQRLHG